MVDLISMMCYYTYNRKIINRLSDLSGQSSGNAVTQSYRAFKMVASCKKAFMFCPCNEGLFYAENKVHLGWKYFDHSGSDPTQIFKKGEGDIYS